MRSSECRIVLDACTYCSLPSGTNIQNASELRREPELPLPWQGGSGVRHSLLHGSQHNTSPALQGRPGQGVFCLMTPPTKAISLMRTCALEAVGLCKSTTFSSPCPKASPIMGWFWDYVYQTACGYIGSCVWFLFQYTTNYSQDRCRITCVQVYPWGQALPFCWDQQCKQHEMQLKKYSRIRYQTSCAMCGPGNFIHVLLCSLRGKRAHQTKDLELENYLVTRFLLLLLTTWRRLAFTLSVQSAPQTMGEDRACPEDQAAQKLCLHYKLWHRSAP